MTNIYVRWQSGDRMLDESLARHWASGFKVSPCRLMIFQRMTWLAETSESQPAFIYSHIGEQKVAYNSPEISMLCGFQMRLYGVSNIKPLINIEQLDDKQICGDCSSKAEFDYWVKLK